MVKYTYDAWGNCSTAVVAESYRNLAEANPYRYRGYYFDVETGLYYLKSRYYDPETGRFISQDDISYIDPETINGLNLYAYCGNNPVMRVDPTGTDWVSFWKGVGRFLGGLVLAIAGFALSLLTVIPALISPIATVTCEFGLTVGMYGVALMGSAFSSTVYEDMVRIGWNPYNQNADAAAQSQIISFYKGAPIIRADIGSGRSGSFGIIVLDRSYANADMVRHEFGHIPQLMILGIFRYGTCIGIPSWKEWHKRISMDYYNAPWDAGADYFGGVIGRTHSKEDLDRAMKYLLLSFFAGPAIHAFYKYL